MDYKNYIGALVNRQAKANMQSHMRERSTGYPDSDSYKPFEYSEERLERLKKFESFKKIIYPLSYYLYRKKLSIYGYDTEEINFLDLLNHYEVDLNLCAEYLKDINEEILSRKDFLDGNVSRFIGSNNLSLRPSPSLQRLNGDSEPESDIVLESKISISYIAGNTENNPNMLRMHIIEKKKSGKILKGIVDFCSNGEVIIHDFVESLHDSKSESNNIENSKFADELETRNVDKSVSVMDLDHFDEIEETFMKLFELSNLETRTTGYHK